MADDNLEDLRRQLNEALQQVGDLRNRVKEVNDEAKGHRLNADNFRRQAEEARARVDELTTEVGTLKTQHDAAMTTLRTEHTTALESIRGEHSTALEGLRTELGSKVTEADTARTAAETTARERTRDADLRIAAKDLGIVDIDGLRLLDMGKVKVDEKTGSVTNAVEVIGELKTAKPFLFGTAKTSNTETSPPKPGDNTHTKRATEMTVDEYKAARALAASGKLPPAPAAAA